ncbi:metallophosphoesterase [Consotaella salsifontis]|uniref:Calcineurin-like phosphoesterase n=1 Tax=Consotaella salsifontis TaxID=1365950 RepID=A0A1T4SS12_9HYPH|nr:metallophosphoesterase [Consotaella salsifontis]SKA30671.1 Calcineurin-like phosphoesterase [Consotaella salsifontis]
MIVAQISDIHAAPGNGNISRLDRALSWLGDVALDALVVSGDLIDEGWTDGYREISARFDTLCCPVLLLPGNSDDGDAMRGVFARRFGSVECANAMHFAADLSDLLLVGVDATLSATSGGDVSPHLGWLEDVLTDSAPRASLVFSHHHLFPSGIAPLDESMAQGAEALRDLLRQCSCKPLAISCGHVHRPMSGMIAGVPVHVCGSICPANPLWFGGVSVPTIGEPPMLMVHRLDGCELVSHHVAV